MFVAWIPLLWNLKHTSHIKFLDAIRKLNSSQHYSNDHASSGLSYVPVDVPSGGFQCLMFFSHWMKDMVLELNEPPTPNSATLPTGQPTLREPVGSHMFRSAMIHPEKIIKWSDHSQSTYLLSSKGLINILCSALFSNLVSSCPQHKTPFLLKEITWYHFI